MPVCLQTRLQISEQVSEPQESLTLPLQLVEQLLLEYPTVVKGAIVTDSRLQGDGYTHSSEDTI